MASAPLFFDKTDWTFNLLDWAAERGATGFLFWPDVEDVAGLDVEAEEEDLVLPGSEEAGSWLEWEFESWS